MAVHTSTDLLRHQGHALEIVVYGNEIGPQGPVSPPYCAIRCDNCGVVLMDFDAEGRGDLTT